MLSCFIVFIGCVELFTHFLSCFTYVYKLFGVFYILEFLSLLKLCSLTSCWVTTQRTVRRRPSSRGSHCCWLEWVTTPVDLQRHEPDAGAEAGATKAAEALLPVPLWKHRALRKPRED